MTIFSNCENDLKVFFNITRIPADELDKNNNCLWRPCCVTVLCDAGNIKSNIPCVTLQYIEKSALLTLVYTTSAYEDNVMRRLNV